MDDVELVFANAMEFNEDQSDIWMDAVTMRVSYHVVTIRKIQCLIMV